MAGETGQRRRSGRLEMRWVQSLGAGLLATILYASGILTPVERLLSEMRFGLSGRDASGTLVVVGIDPESLKQLDDRPWPRGYHAAVIDRLVDAGAEMIAFDIDLGSYSTPVEDGKLEESLARAGGRVVLPAFRQAAGGLDGGKGVTNYTAPMPAFRRQAQIASVNAVPESDGLVWRHSASDKWSDGILPTMAGMLADGGFVSLGLFYVDYGIRPSSLPYLSYVDVMAGDFDPAVVAGRKVIVGATAIELGDQFTVPYYRNLPGPVLQALAYESLVQGRVLHRAAPWLIVVGIFASAFGFGRIFRFSSWRRGLAGGGVFVVIAIGVSVAAQIWLPIMLEVTPWIAAVVILFVSELGFWIDRQELTLLVRGARLRRSTALMRSVVESSSDGILSVSRDLVIELANPAAETLFGAERNELIGRSLETLVPSFDSVEALTIHLAEQRGSREIEGVRVDGGEVPLEVTVDSMQLDGQQHFVVIGRDVTVRQAQQKLLEYLALHDTLTGLPNRTLLMDRLDHAISMAEREGKPLALMLLDLDRFKEINDTLGHGVGDSLLTEVGRMLGAPLRSTDTIARLGGDEFAVLLPAVSGPTQALDVAGRIADALRKPFPVDNLTLEVGVSIGVALYPDHGTDASALMRSADVAMYVAKGDHSTVSLYDPYRDTNSVRNLSMSGELRKALDDDELVLFLQPQVEVTGGRVTGAEALVRWQHPRYGLVPPVEFISLAEQTGVIRPLSRWILGKAVRQLAEWEQRGLSLGLSINLSPRNLHEDDLAEVVSGLLAKHKVAPERLTLEITENAIMTDPESALHAIHMLKACNVRLAIDDFGTGYSSLAYLKTLPVDELKIDKSFVMQMTTDRSDEVIVRSTIDLAHNLGLSVVAEGVEADPHLVALRRLGCDIAQGYYISRPFDSSAFLAWLEGWKGFAAEAQKAEDGAASATVAKGAATVRIISGN